MPIGPSSCWAATAFGTEKPIHPNDHVNMGQSTNDMFPTAIHVAVAVEIRKELVPGLKRLGDELAAKAKAWDKIIKIGRTHLADATPLRLGQEIGGLARQLALSVERAERAVAAVLELPAGGTAVGTGINTHPEFGRRVAAALAKETGVPFVEAADHFEGNAQRDGLVECHGELQDHRHHAIQRGQQYSLARIGTALRLLTKSNFPTASRAARSCRARSTR